MSIFTKSRSIALRAALAGLIGFGAVACSNDDSTEVTMQYAFNFSDEVYNKDGYWVNAYNTAEEYSQLVVGSYTNLVLAAFSHSASAEEYYGIVYRSYTGFCPSKVRDNSDHSADQWVDYQWGAMAPNIASGYMIAHWDVQESGSKHSCSVKFTTTVTPVSMTVTNTAWGYWAMKNGSDFSKPFGPDDKFTLTAHGLKNGVESATIDFDLAVNGRIVDNWTNVDLRELGPCNEIYFTMSSTDTGEWGMNNPAYFAMRDLVVHYSSNN